MSEQIVVNEVKTKKDRKEFLNFPLRLYDKCPYFVPPLYGDEKKIFDEDYVYADTCDSVYFIAKKEGKTVGRISGILQKASNEKAGQKRVRFTRFDSINDEAVAKKLFEAVENWAKERGMEEVCGPLGFCDQEREGLLVEGFDQLSTFEEQYNFDYYESLIEKCGYEKEVEWVERKLFPPKTEEMKKKHDEYIKVANALLKRYDLHFGEAKNTNDFLRKYADQFFELLDKTYSDIYGTVPFTEKAKKSLIAGFKILLNLKYVTVIVDKNDKVVCLGVCFPTMAEALNKSKGKLTPITILRILKSKRKPKIIELGLIGVEEEYARKGVSAAVIAEIMKMLRNDGIEFAETNLNLVDNVNILNNWKRFDNELHKRRRAYIKKLN